MKICIIGGAGYVGSVLTKEFLDNNYEVVVLDLLRRGSDGILQHKDNPNFTLINSNFISDILDIALKDVDVVVHLAAIVGDKACAEEPGLATLTNVNGVKFLIEKCNQYEVPFYFASTCSVYGSNPNTCNEKSIVNPISHYAETKYQAEQIIKKESNTGRIFRFGTMYGWSPNMRFDLVVNRLVHDAVKYKQFKIFGGKQARPFIHPKDLSMFLMQLFKANDPNGIKEVYNLVSENLTMIELGELVERLIPTSQMEVLPETQVERTYICRSFKAYKELGWSPKIRVRDGIQEIECELLKLEESSPIDSKVYISQNK